MAIVDPHVKRTDQLYVYTEGKELDVLYKDANGNEFDGWCWTGSSAWVDFFNPKSHSWWKSLYRFDKWKVRLRSTVLAPALTSTRARLATCLSGTT